MGQVEWGRWDGGALLPPQPWSGCSDGNGKQTEVSIESSDCVCKEKGSAVIKPGVLGMLRNLCPWETAEMDDSQCKMFVSLKAPKLHIGEQKSVLLN